MPISGKIGMSEYGVGSNVDYHEEDPGYRVGTGFDAYQSEEFQAQWHEIYYEAIEELSLIHIFQSSGRCGVARLMAVKE